MAILSGSPSSSNGSTECCSSCTFNCWKMLISKVIVLIFSPPPRLPKEALVALQSLISQYDDGEEDIDVKTTMMIKNGNCPMKLRVSRLSGAMTNKVYKVQYYWPNYYKPSCRVVDDNNEKRQRRSKSKSKSVLVRIYGEGTSVLFEREMEANTFKLVSDLGFGPKLLGDFKNGRIEEFLPAKTLTAHDLHDPKISGLIAAKMREFHDLNMPAVKKAMIWDRLRVWLKAAKDKATPEEASEFRLERLGEEINTLEKTLSEGNQRIGFCHNDLQYGNIMMDNENDTVTMIDYEYASFNPVAFDIGNHFCEMAANYHTKTPHVLDFGKYPGYNRRKEFVLAYLRSSGDEANEEEAEQLMDDIEKFTIVSHLLWTLWGIISEHVNNIDFKYIEYARQRFEQYRKKKLEILDNNAFAA